MKVITNAPNDYVKRINEIYQILKKNDFGYLIEENTFIKIFPFLKNRNAPKEEDVLDDRTPQRMRKVLEELGPAYIKLGQMLSTRPDLVGVEIAEELEKLRDNTPITPFDEIKTVIENELQKPIEDVFSEIDETPIGSASIGQVYKGKLKKNNEEVAIKVQKPNSIEIIEKDIKIMNLLATKTDQLLSMTRTYNLPAMISEFERSIFKEINYLEEVMNMQNLAENFKHIKYIKIPKPYTEYCSEKLITMELIKGITLSDLINGDYPEIDKKKIAKHGVKSYFKQIMIDGYFHADPHPGNLIVTEDNRLCYIDLGMMGILNEEFKETLAELILLILTGNTNNIIKQLIYMDIITPAQNTDQLKVDIDDLIMRYYGVELKNMDGAMKDLLDVMVKNNIVLPREFVMIGRGITLIEDAGKKLDPEFNAATELKKMSTQIVKNKYKPKRLGKVGLNYLLQMEHLAKDLPDTINNTISKFEAGKIELNLKHSEISQLANQLSVSLILSSLIIGSSLALLAKVGPAIYGIPILGLVGFVFSAILGGYLVIEFMIGR